jgi:anthranilate synthase component 1
VLEEQRTEPLQALKELLANRRPIVVPGLPHFTGGAVGYFGYDLVRFMERLPATAAKTLDVPDMVLLFSDNLVVFDHVRHRLIVIANMRTEGDLLANYADAVARIEPGQGAHRRRRHLPGRAEPALQPPHQRPPVRRLPGLRMLNPSPYMFYFNFAPLDLQVIGASPEMHVRLEDGVASVRPIAGTRRARQHPGRRRGAGHRAAGRPQGAGRTRDAGRPGAQRYRPRLRIWLRPRAAT